jgi:uncharacterized membrane protein YbhN (UPF0104 family)
MKSNTTKLISKKKLIINLIVILVVTGLMLYFLFKNNVFSDLSSLQTLPFTSYLIIAGVLLLTVCLESFVIYSSLRRINKKKPFIDAIGIYLHGNLGGTITPSRTGHFPFMLYYMQKRGITIDESLNCLTQNQIIFSLVQGIMFGIMFITCQINDCTLVLTNGTQIKLIWIALYGFAFAVISALFFILMAYCPPVNKLIVKISAFFAFKFKKTPSKEAYIRQSNEKMERVRSQVGYLMKHFYLAIPSLIAYSLFQILSNSIPYIIYLLLGQGSIKFDLAEMFFFLASYQAIGFIGTLSPIPSNAGVSEATFTIVFGTIMGNYVGAALLLWRIFTSYFLLAISFTYFIISTIVIQKLDDKKMQIDFDNTYKNMKDNGNYLNTRETALLCLKMKQTQCMNCKYLQNNMFICDKYKIKPLEILDNSTKCEYKEEHVSNEEDL